MKKIALTLKFLLGFTFVSFCQNPLHINEVRKVVDSVKNEVNLLYKISEVRKKGVKIIENHYNLNKKTLLHLAYFENDTAFLISYDKSHSILASVKFYDFNNRNYIIDSISRNPSDFEMKLIESEKRAILESIKPEHNINIPDESKIEYLFYPNKNGYTLYVLTIPIVDSIITFGNDHLFLFDTEMILLKKKSIGKLHLVSIRKKDNPPHSKLLGVSSPTGIKNNDFSILIPYYYKFRVYYKNLQLSKLESTINKRSLLYYPKDNEIEINLFPIEKNN